MFQAFLWETAFFPLPQTLSSTFPLQLPKIVILKKKYLLNPVYHETLIYDKEDLTASAASFAALKRRVRC